MDISDALRDEQEALFYSLAPRMFGDAVLVSHAIVSQWDKDRPLTLKRYPEGVEAEHFYEKQAPSHRPDWVHIPVAAIGELLERTPA